MKSEPDDGALCFLLGRCQEANEPAQAVKSFEHAIEYDAPQRPEADSRLAALLVRLDRRNDAKNVIEKMVKDDPKNYRVYLERGSYLRRFGQTQERKAAKDDLQIALEMAPNDPKVYTELAALARSSKNDDEAAGLSKRVSRSYPTIPRFIWSGPCWKCLARLARSTRRSRVCATAWNSFPTSQCSV